MKELRVDSENIHRTGAKIGSAGDRLRSEVQEFQGRLQGFGQPWGNDDVGSLIGMCYQGAYEAFMECVDDNMEALGEHAEGVKTMAANYRESEDLTGVEVNRVRDILGGGI